MQLRVDARMRNRIIAAVLQKAELRTVVTFDPQNDRGFIAVTAAQMWTPATATSVDDFVPQQCGPISWPQGTFFPHEYVRLELKDEVRALLIQAFVPEFPFRAKSSTGGKFQTFHDANVFW